jgi:ABC-type uncharacterized transport system fused permease/ATPase subunit
LRDVRAHSCRLFFVYWPEILSQTELLDSFITQPAEQAITDSSAAHQSDIGFSKASFSWSNESATDGTLTPSRQTFRLHIDDELIFKKGGFNLIIGPTGSGKTSMLMALLGEMHYIPSGPESWMNIPREGGVAYAAQESWVQNETIKVCTCSLRRGYSICGRESWQFGL